MESAKPSPGFWKEERDRMKTSVSQNGDEVIFHLHPEEEDLKYLKTTNIALNGSQAKVDLQGVKINEIHPDLIGLSTILMCHQFIGSRLYLPVEVSKGFLESANNILSKYKICSKCDESIPAYKTPLRARPGLAFSGGADSTAALSVMPGNTVPVFMNRPMRKGSIYDSDAPLKNCELLRQIGYDVKVVDCDLEFLRKPVGFPSDLAHAIPLILLSESLGIGSIAFGTVLESAYGIGHEKYIDYPNGSHKRFYGTLLSAAGLQMSLPVAGVSEVGTAMIVESSSLRNLSQSCIRGKKGQPCQRCWKCFRKELLLMSLFPDRMVDLEGMMRNSSEVQIKLSAYPISHENVVTYSIQRIDVSKLPFLRALKNRLDVKSDLNFLSGWYPPSQALIPKSYRLSVIEKISGFLTIMTREQQEILEKWNMEKFLLLETTKKSHSYLTSSWQDF